MRDGDGSPCVVFESHSASRPTATLNLPILNLQSSKPYTLRYTLHNLHPHSLKSLNLEVSTSKPQTPHGPKDRLASLWVVGARPQGLVFGLKDWDPRD